VNRGVLELIDIVELAVSRSDGSVPTASIAEAQHRIDGLRSRRGHFGEILVVALAGGTGSGKSSLLNAVAGEDVAGVSVLRPHTQTPLAWIPNGYTEGVERLLDDLRISQRVIQEKLAHIAFIDLPDIDSIADWHRQMVERLLPHVDAVLWIVDPEKYRDEVLHEEFLRPLSGFQDQFLFALNKADRLAIVDVDTVRDDLVASLRETGFDQPVVFAFAADPDEGAPVGIDRFVEYLEHQVDVKRVATGKAINDVAAILEEMGDAAGVWHGGFVDFDKRWAEARDTSARELIEQPGAASREDAISRIEDVVAALALEVGPTMGASLRAAFPSERIENAVDMRLATDDTGAADLAARLDAALGEPLRRQLWRRAQFAATLASGVVATHQLRDRYLR
jgi:GTP-binding protein EngB required for normal cell division